MEMDGKRPYCPILDVDGVISGGKQFDLDITLPDVYRIKYQLYNIKEVYATSFASLIIFLNLLVLDMYFKLSAFNIK